MNLRDQITLKRVYGPYTILGLWSDLICGPIFAVHFHLFLKEATGRELKHYSPKRYCSKLRIGHNPAHSRLP